MAKEKKLNIPHVPYKDYLKEVKVLPDRDDPKYIDFWLKHIERCKSGVYTGGIYISGWLYWHINFFILPIDDKDEYGNPVMNSVAPDFRDNEWIIDHAYRDTDQNGKKPIIMFGTRRFAKTAFITSRITYKSYIFKNSNSLVIGASQKDINNITQYFDGYYEKRPDCFSDLMKFGDWAKTGADVEINYNKRSILQAQGSLNPITNKLLDIGKDNKYNFSRVAIRNLEFGQVATKEELLRGITPTEVIWDEVGAFLWEKQHEALLPALATPYGKRCTEILCGTGGNTDFSTDAEKYFMNPIEMGFYHFPIDKYLDSINDIFFKYRQKSDSKIGLFVPCEMSLDGGEKIEIPLKDYVKKKYTKKEEKEIDGFNIKITDWDNATNKIEKILEEAKNKGETAYNKARMYLPKQPEDCFLFTNKNPFPVEEAKKVQRAIYEQKLTGEYVVLDQDEQGNVIVNFSDKEVVTEYPFKGGSHDAPVIIYERPISENPLNIKYGTYCAGFDGYKIDTSDTTDSLGSIFIYKRLYTLSGFSKQIVASLATRPTQDSKFYRQCYLLLKMYNAEVLPERDTNFRKYMDGIKAMRYWAQCKNLVQGIVKNSKANTDDGLPTSIPNKQHILKLVKNYCHDEILIGYDDNKEAIMIKGVERIPDPMLLEEIIQFGRYKNYDRITSFGHALAWDEEMTRMKVDGGLDEKQEKEIDPDKLIQMFKHKRWLRTRM